MLLVAAIEHHARKLAQAVTRAVAEKCSGYSDYEAGDFLAADALADREAEEDVAEPSYVEGPHGWRHVVADGKGGSYALTEPLEHHCDCGLSDDMDDLDDHAVGCTIWDDVTTCYFCGNPTVNVVNTDCDGDTELVCKKCADAELGPFDEAEQEVAGARPYPSSFDPFLYRKLAPQTPAAGQRGENPAGVTPPDICRVRAIARGRRAPNRPRGDQRAMGRTVTETWRPVLGHEGFYEVSDHGRVRSIDRTINGSRRVGRIMSQQLRTDRGLRVTVRLNRDGKRPCSGVGQLVLTAFKGPCPPGMECCHNNGDATDNRPDNLRWDTHSANVVDTVVHGTHACAIKTKCLRGHKLPPHQPNQKRNCVTCKRDRRKGVAA